MLRNDERYLKNICKHFKNLKKHFKKLQKYQYGLDYLFNEHNEEDYTSNNDINAFKEARKLLNERRSNFLRKETKRIRKELYKKETVYNSLKEKDSLTNKQNIELKNISKYLKKLNNDLKKLYKYQNNIIYGLDYLFNELNGEDYYKPKEIKNAFDGSYILYESRGDKDNKLALYEYFDIIRPFLKDMIDNHKSKDEWKIQLSMQMIFVSFTDPDETRDMHTKSDNVTIMSGIEIEDVITERFNVFRRRYQEGLETKIKGSSFTFERIDLLEYHLHKISLNRGSSYIKSSEWIKNKGVTINPNNTKDNNYFQYTITAELNYQNIDSHLERISKLKPFINNYNWKDIEYPSHSKDWRKCECNNKTIALNILYVPYNTKQIKQAYISKHNDERDTRVNLLMITDGTSNWHYLATKSISGLLRGITSNHNGDFYCLNCFHVYTTEKKLREHERICKDHDFCHPKMRDEDNKILKYIPGEKLLKVPFTIYTDIECLLKKINTCSNNPDKSYTEKKATYRPSGYSLVTFCSFDKSKNEQKYYRREDCMKIFCKDLKDQAMKIINYEKKEMIPLTDKEKESYENQKICHKCEKEFCTDENNKEF